MVKRGSVHSLRNANRSLAKTDRINLLSGYCDLPDRHFSGDVLFTLGLFHSVDSLYA